MMEGEPMMPQGVSPKSEETEFQTEKELIPENEIKKIFEEDSPDEFFSKAVDLAVSDPMKFSNTYKEFFKGEDFPDRKAPDGRLNALRIFAWSFVNADNEPGPEKSKEELIQKIKEAEEFCDSMEQRKREVSEKAGRVFEGLNIQEHGKPLYGQESEKITEELLSGIYDAQNDKSERILGSFVHYYLHSKGELFFSNSVAGQGQDISLLNRRTKEIINDFEETKKVLDEVSGKVRQIIEKSNDPELIAYTNKLNLNASSVCALEEGDFLHGSFVGGVDSVRKIGFMCREVVAPSIDSGCMNCTSVSFGKQKSDVNDELERKSYKNPLIRELNENSFLGQYHGNVASWYGANDETVRNFLRTGEKRDKMTNEEELRKRPIVPDVKAAGDDAITYILKDQQDAFAQGASVCASHSDEYCVGIGVPSTEIKGVIVDASSEEAIKKVLSKLAEFPFYIPAYDSETGVLLNKKMKELYK